jgi:signal transduction histidine kinase
LATASEGKLSIHVRPGHGTTFSFTWPLHASQSVEPCPSPVPSPSPTA